MARKGERGVALIIVLWGVVLLSFLAAAFSGSTRTGANLARNLVENAKAEALADAGVNRVVLELRRPAEEGGIGVDGTPYAWPFAGGEVRFQAQDEAGKIDLNAASIELFRDMFLAVGVGPEASEALADAIADYRDADDDPRPLGAEDGDYRAAGLKHEAKDRPFDVVEELQQVLGITGPVYRRVAPLLTVWSQQPDPIREVAPLEIRAILGWEPDLAPESNDDRRFYDRDTPFADDEDDADSFVRMQDGGSTARSGRDIYTVHAEGRTLNGAVFVREAVIGLAESERRPYTIFAWRQGQRTLFPTGNEAMHGLSPDAVATDIGR